MTATEKLKHARAFSPGIAEWIDAKLARGVEPEAIAEELRLVTALAIFQRKWTEAKS